MKLWFKVAVVAVATVRFAGVLSVTMSGAGSVELWLLAEETKHALANKHAISIGKYNCLDFILG